MGNELMNTLLNPPIHSAVASLECHRLVTSMETEAREEHHARSTADLFESIVKIEDPTLAEELTAKVASLQGMDTSQVSVEALGSLIPAIRSLFGMGKRKKKEEDSRDKLPESNNQLIEFLDKFYLNQSWLAAQEFIEGTVAGTDLSSALGRDGKFNPVTFPADIVRFSKEFELFLKKYRDAVTKYSGEILALDKALVKEIDALDDKAKGYEETVIDLVRATAKKMYGLNDPAKIAASKFKLMGSYQTGVVKESYNRKPEGNHLKAVIEPSKEVVPVERVPAISRDKVKDIAAAVLHISKVLEDFDETYYLWPDHSDGRHEFLTAVEGTDDDLWELYGNLMYKQSQTRRLLNSLNFYYPIPDVIVGALKWIDRSIVVK